MNDAERSNVFNDWMSRHKGVLFKVVRAYAFTRCDQDDLFQEISLQLWNSIPNFARGAAETTWIYRVSLYTALTWSRNERKHHQQRRAFDAVEHGLTKAPPSRDGRLDWLYDQIARLEEIDRCTALMWLDRMSYKEIASALGISESNVGVKINRIKKQLARHCEREGCHGL